MNSEHDGKREPEAAMTAAIDAVDAAHNCRPARAHVSTRSTQDLLYLRIFLLPKWELSELLLAVLRNKQVRAN